MASNLFVALTARRGFEEVGRAQQRVFSESLLQVERRLLARALFHLRFWRRKKREFLFVLWFDMVRTNQDAANGMASPNDARVEFQQGIRDLRACVRCVDADRAGGWRDEKIGTRAVDDAHGNGRRDDVTRCEA